MSGAVLDSFALIAFFRNEPGADAVEQRFLSAVESQQFLAMTEVNYSETKYMILRKNGEDAWNQVFGVLQSLPIQFFPADRHLSDIAATFKSQNKLSLADAYAAALSQSLDLPLITGDPEFKQLEKEIKIHWLPVG